MNDLFSKISIVITVFLFLDTVNAEKYVVNSQQSFENAHDDAGVNDSIIWETGTFSDIYMIVDKDNLYIGSETLGSTIFNGASRIRVNSDFVTLEGVQYIGGNIGTNDIINIYGSNNLFTQINIDRYTCYKYLRIREQCQYVSVTYCNFENRLNLADQNILSILVDANNPGFHKVQYCSFKNIDGTGNDLGIEPIRIGLSTQADRNSRSLVEYCYFTQCNGDGELISSKSSQNVYRYNTFENNPLAELVLRHGSQNIVYSNFFLNGKGGVRIREGQNHYIYNNYFYELDDRPLFIQNESSDPLDNINIAFNAIIECDEIRLGGTGSNKPTNVTFANNIFVDPDDSLFEDPTNTETWIGNITKGSLGIPIPSSGLNPGDPNLVENSKGFFGLEASSPAINNASSGYLELPQFEGMDPIDSEILFDLMKENRPASITEKDIGCSEFPHNVMIQPMATEDNTGPIYLQPPVTSIRENGIIVDDLFTFSPNPVESQILINLDHSKNAEIIVDILNFQGQTVKSLFDDLLPAGEHEITEDMTGLPSGAYFISMKSRNIGTGILKLQTSSFIKL